MTNAAKHFDPQIGIDIHMYEMPPGPLPTAHISIVLDPFDYLPFIGATVQVAGVKRATAGTQGLSVHIPLGVWMPPLRAPEGPQFDDQIFMGSKTVLADGSPFSRLGMPVLDCSVVGMVPPFRLKKSAEPHMSMTLPTSVNLAIPDTVFVGGPPSIMEALEGIAAQLALAGLLKGLGKGLKALRETKAFKRAADALKTKYKKLFENMESGFLKCKVLRAEPVDIRDGSVAVSHQDFSIPGRLPLSWNRNYSSGNSHDGMCGYGWQTPADFRLEIDPDGIVLFFDASGAAVFPQLPAAAGGAHAVTEFVDGARLILAQGAGGDELHVLTKNDLRYVFRRPAANVTPLHQALSLKIERIEDLCGNHWRFERADGHLTRIVESGIGVLPGRFIEVHEHDGKIHQLSLHDPATGLTHPLVAYKYQNRDMVAALDALNAARTFEYDRHHMVRHADRLGLSFYYAYDSEWRVVHAWGDQGLHDYRFVYNELLRETEVTDSLGHTSLIKFDENNLPLCEIDPLGGVTIFEYDEVGRTTAIVDPIGSRTEFDYDERGNLLKLIQPDDSVIASEYDADDMLVAITDPTGQIWRQRGDSRRLLCEKSDPLGATSHYGRDVYGQLATHINARGAATRLVHDRYGMLQSLTDAYGQVSRFEHDALGRLLAQTDALGQSTRYDYDAKGRLLRVLQFDGAEVRCEYDAEDQLTHYTDESGAITRLQYVGIGKLGKRIQPDGCTVEYHYDSEEQLIGLTNQLGEHYQLRRDELGRIVEETDYWGQTRCYQYDAAGRLAATVDPLHQRIEFQTDKLGRIVKKTLPDTEYPGQQIQESFRYDQRGLLVELGNRNRQVKRRFDATGRLVEESQDGFQIAYRYDETGNRIERHTSSGNRVACAYDLRDQVVAIVINEETPITLQRDALGRTTREQLSEQVRREFQYDARSLLSAQMVLSDAASLFETRYGHDSSGNLSWRSDSQQGEDLYQYDVLGRLLQHTDPKGNIARYINDSVGDRIKTRIHQVQMKRAAGGTEQVDMLWTREGKYEDVPYVFDRAGDLIRRGTPGNSDSASELLLSWDANHRLVESRKNGNVTKYGYDPLGRRVFKRNTTDTTWFFWDGDALLGEVKQANNDPQATPIWAANIGNLIEVRKRKERLNALHQRANEYVYYPCTLVPLALIDKRQTASKHDAANTKSQSKISSSSAAAKSSEPEAQGLGTMGGITLGQPSAVLAPQLAQQLTHDTLFLNSENEQKKDDVIHVPSGMQLGGLGTVALGGTRAVQSQASSNWVSVPAEQQKKPEAASAFFAAGEQHHPATGEEKQPETSKESTDDCRATIYHYHVDPNGCPTRLTDKIGRVVWSASYNAWGSISDEHAQQIQNLLRFQGQYYDIETDLHYNRYRYYEPVLGQFVSRDPLGLLAGENFYRYAPNPIAWADPLGLIPLDHTGADGKGYTIYALVDRNTQEVKYVGLTEDSRFWERMKEHTDKGRFHADLESIELDSARTYAEARGKEQAYIDIHHETAYNSAARGKKFGVGTEGNRQVGFDVNRTDDRGKAFKKHYDASMKCHT